MKEIEIKVRRLLLKIFLSFFKAERSSVEIPGEPKVLIIRLNKIGDALVTTPLITLLKTKKQADITVLADKKNHFVFRRNPYVAETKIFEKGFTGFRKTLAWINSGKFDVIVDAHDDVSTTVSFIVALAKAPNKYALEKGNANIFTRTISKTDPRKTHIVERVAEIAKLFDVNFGVNDLQIFYQPSEDSIRKAESFISANIKNKKYLLGINISAGSDARFWGVENYRRIINWLGNFEDLEIIILRAPADKKKAEEISNGKIPVFNDESFDEFAAIISKLDLLFTPDTSAVHLASAFGIPVFGLYVHYNTEDMIWSPYKSEFDCVITKSETLSDIDYHQVIKQLKPFIRKIFYGEENSRL